MEVGHLERESLDLLDLLLISPLISAMHIHAVVAIGDAPFRSCGHPAPWGGSDRPRQARFPRNSAPLSKPRPGRERCGGRARGKV
jgi:hypothetical protein